MKNKIKNIIGITIILSTIIFCSNTYATSTTNSSNTSTNSKTNSSSNSTSNKTNKTNTSSNTTSGSSTKSSDATLSDLGIKPNDFKGFKSGTTSYKTTVPEDVAEVEVYAKTTSSKATVTGTGKKKLENGTNKVEVIVTAENGTKKTYTIEITREEKNEETATTAQAEETTVANENIGDGLSSLKIEDLKIEPDFKTNVYEYKVKYIGDATSLDIQTETTNPEFIAEVVGNQELVEGENIITILVSDADGNNIATYQITVEKSLVDYEVLAREKAEKQRNMIIGGVVVAALVIGIIVFVVIRRKRNKNIAREFSIPYSNLNNDNDDFMANEDEMSKVLVRAGSRKSEEETAGKVESNTPNAKLADEETKKMDIQKIREEYLNNFNNQENKEPTKSSRVIRRKGKRYM